MKLLPEDGYLVASYGSQYFIYIDYNRKNNLLLNLNIDFRIFLIYSL